MARDPHPPRRTTLARAAAALALLLAPLTARGAVGDPQLKTDHPWYPGELSCSTFDRLFKTEAEVYHRVTGRGVDTDEDKALAAWLWRNTHFAHGEEGRVDCFAAGFDKAEWNREYWTGLFAHGFGLCGTTHAQWTAEMEALLGHGRSRDVGVAGHNSFEVYLTGGAYGDGRWALLDHDLSTVIYAPDGKRLLSIPEVMADLSHLRNPAYQPQRQHGWRIAGEHDDDAAVYSAYNTAEYLNGYAGPPPVVQLRRGESLRRYFKPGLDDGRTYVFWGMNYKMAGIPGPARDRTWVNQPDRMYQSKNGTGARAGQVRFANAVYGYAPNFADGSYKEGVVDESADHVTFEFYSPYVIGATPPNDKPWGVYDAGGRNGLVLHATAAATTATPPSCGVRVSVDQGQTWHDAGPLADGLDLTDHVKGRRQYWLRFDAPVAALRDAKLSWRTVCQCNVAILPRLKDGTNTITYLASGTGLVDAGPTADQAAAHVVDGKFGTKTVTLELRTPRGEPVTHLYAASWQASGAPPSATAFRIDYSADNGVTWQAVVKDWRIVRHEPEPRDFWSQSFCWGDVALPSAAGPVRVRFTNDGNKSYRLATAHLAYSVQHATPAEVTFAWQANGGDLRTATHTYAAVGTEDSSWKFDAGQNAETLWVEEAAR